MTVISHKAIRVLHHFLAENLYASEAGIQTELGGDVAFSEAEV